MALIGCLVVNSGECRADLVELRGVGMRKGYHHRGQLRAGDGGGRWDRYGVTRQRFVVGVVGGSGRVSELHATNNLSQTMKCYANCPNAR